MSRQYKRAYDLTIIPQDGQARVIRDLRVSFEITKSVLSFPNLCRLIIYNPNSETIAALQKRFTQIVINAGYEGNLRLLFKGEVRNVFQAKQETDRLITVYAGDGQRDWENAIFNKTFSANVTVKSIVEEVVKTFTTLTSGTIRGLPEKADKLLGETLSGSSKDILDTYAEEYGFNWSIQDGEIVITPIDEPIRENEAVLINAQTGMIGSPVVTEIGADVTSLLNPRLLPNRLFRIEAIGAEVQLGNTFFRNIPRTSAIGNYTVQEVIFKGDSREGDWLSAVKGRLINGG